MAEKKLVLPGNFGTEENRVDTDSRRCEFDIKNEQIVFTDRKVDIVFAGDSIINFMEENQFYHKYGYVVNRGIGGDMTKYMKRRFAADVTQLEPTLCIMLIGCNNLWPLENEIDGDDYKEEAQIAHLKELIDDFGEMLDEAEANGFTMWISSILPHGATVVNAAMRNKFIARANGELAALCERRGTEYLDFHANLVKEDGLTMKDNISREGIHPNHAGYELMRQVLEPKLDKFFAK